MKFCYLYTCDMCRPRLFLFTQFEPKGWSPRFQLTEVVVLPSVIIHFSSQGYAVLFLNTGVCDKFTISKSSEQEK